MPNLAQTQMRLFVQYRIEQIQMLVEEKPDITPKNIAFSLNLPLRTVYKTMEYMGPERRAKPRGRRTTDGNFGPMLQKNLSPKF